VCNFRLVIFVFMKYLILCFLLIFSHSLFAQKNTDTVQPTLRIYQTFEDFKLRKPTIIVPGTIDSQYYILNIDTVITGFSCKFQDSTMVIKNAFCVVDGDRLFLYGVKGDLIPSNGTGQFPFFAKTENTKYAWYLSPTIGLVSLADAIFSGGSRNVVTYYNKKGKVMQATPQSIGVLLRNDKDFLKEYEKEKKYNNDVYIKYLNKMNERYPL